MENIAQGISNLLFSPDTANHELANSIMLGHTFGWTYKQIYSFCGEICQHFYTSNNIAGFFRDIQAEAELAFDNEMDKAGLADLILPIFNFDWNKNVVPCLNFKVLIELNMGVDWLKWFKLKPDDRIIVGFDYISKAKFSARIRIPTDCVRYLEFNFNKYNLQKNVQKLIKFQSKNLFVAFLNNQKR